MFSDNYFRLSVVNYLNAAPLNYGFKHGLGSDFLYLNLQTPSLCADSLRRGEVDASLLSSVEYLRIANIKIIPGCCIASKKRVRSVLLLVKTKLCDIRTVAMDTSSRTSVVLCQILLRERYGVYAKIINMAPDQAVMLSKCDAALLIGDAAMRAKRDGLLVMDLAEEWYDWTGLPFVFAIWAVRDRLVEPNLISCLAELFNKSLEMGNQNLDIIVSDAQSSIGWSKYELKEYLTKNIFYKLGSAELSSLELFYEKVVEHGFVEKLKKIQFF